MWNTTMLPPEESILNSDGEESGIDASEANLVHDPIPVGQRTWAPLCEGSSNPSQGSTQEQRVSTKRSSLRTGCTDSFEELMCRTPAASRRDRTPGRRSSCRAARAESFEELICRTPKGDTKERAPSKRSSLCTGCTDSYEELMCRTPKTARSSFAGGWFPRPPATPLPAVGFREALLRNTPQPQLPAAAWSSKTPAPRGPGCPPLLRAMRAGSVDQVATALAENPEAVRDLFFDCDFEPALCIAVRLQCDASMIRLLLNYRADPGACDRKGANSLTALSDINYAQVVQEEVWPDDSVAAWARAAARQQMGRCLAIARELIDVGASPNVPDGMGRRPAEAALASGNTWLAFYWQYCLEVRACTILSRACSSTVNGGAIGRLTPDAVKVVTDFLVPGHVVLPLPAPHIAGGHAR